jgi:hypothetical protein
MGMHLTLQMIQKGKMRRRRVNHERTNMPNSAVAPTSKPEYLHSLALSNNTSLTSCTRRVLTPARYVLQQLAHGMRQVQKLHRN